MSIIWDVKRNRQASPAPPPPLADRVSFPLASSSTYLAYISPALFGLDTYHMLYPMTTNYHYIVNNLNHPSQTHVSKLNMPSSRSCETKELMMQSSGIPSRNGKWGNLIGLARARDNTAGLLRLSSVHSARFTTQRTSVPSPLPTSTTRTLSIVLNQYR